MLKSTGLPYFYKQLGWCVKCHLKIENISISILTGLLKCSYRGSCGSGGVGAVVHRLRGWQFPSLHDSSEITGVFINGWISSSSMYISTSKLLVQCTVKMALGTDQVKKVLYSANTFRCIESLHTQKILYTVFLTDIYRWYYKFPQRCLHNRAIMIKCPLRCSHKGQNVQSQDEECL